MRLLLILIAVFLGVASEGHGGDETASYFRREGGVSGGEKSRFPRTLEEAALRWRQPLDAGHSTPCVYGDRVYLTTHKENELAVVALYRETGRVRWKRTVPVTELESFHKTGSPAVCSPATDGERLYVFFGSYGLLAYDLEGQQLWSQRMGPFQDEFGASSSPVLLDDMVIINQDHDVDSFLMAIDKTNGRILWRTPREEFTRSYSTPIVWEHGGVQEIVVAGSRQLAGYNPKDGAKTWWINGMARIVSPTPVVAGDLLYATGWTPGGDEDSRIAMESFAEARKELDKDGDGKIGKAELPDGSPVSSRFFRIDLDQDQGLDESEWKFHAEVFQLSKNKLLAVRPGGKGDVTESHVAWDYERNLPSVPSPLVYRGVLYLVKDGGIVTSVDPETGTVLKRGRARGVGKYYASPVAADGRVYLASERGMLTVLKAGAQWEVESYRDFEERIMATPVLRDGVIYLRTDDALYAFGSAE